MQIPARHVPRKCSKEDVLLPHYRVELPHTGFRVSDKWLGTGCLLREHR
jgi:hypothetical protein